MLVSDHVMEKIAEVIRDPETMITLAIEGME
jgi:hypothetical protein